MPVRMFKEGQQVVWRRRLLKKKDGQRPSTFAFMLKQLIEKHGAGPFPVIDAHAATGSGPPLHPQVVIIRVREGGPEDGQEINRSFSGIWFEPLT